MKSTRRYPSRISKRGAESALTMLLTGCTAERLAGFTAVELRGAYNVPIAKIEQMLAAARRTRNSEFVVPSADNVAPHQADGAAIHEKALDVGRGERRESR